MASPRYKLAAGAIAGAIGAVGWLVYSVFAAEAQGSLAQAPLNNQVQVAPAFMMAVDDSGSMTFETMFPGRDGYGCWDTGTANPFFDTEGNLRTTGNCAFHHLFPYAGHRIDTGRYAIPPIDLFGFARSPAYNPSYFDPAITYSPWLKYDGSAYPQASLTATVPDPRQTAPTFDMTAVHSDRTDDDDPGFDTVGSAAYASGTRFPKGIMYARNGACGGLATTGGNTTFVTLVTDVTLNARCTDISLRRPQAGQPAADELFRIPSGTTLPTGTAYYRLADSACGGLAAAAPTRRIWVTLTNPVTLNATCEVGIRYFPATFFLPLDVPAPGGFDATKRVLASNAGGAGVDLWRYEIRPANYANVADYDAAIQNFANWFAYYGNRNRSMIAGMTRSLIDVNNMRVGYFTINQHGSRDEPVGKAAERVAMHDMTQVGAGGGKSRLYGQILSLPASGSTPNRQAVNAIGQQFMRTDTDRPVQLSCQKNAGMLFTDGYSNQDGPGRSNATGDGNMGTPFSDGHSNTMADIAAYYYNTNLQTSLTAGKVPVARDCPATGDSTDPSLDCNRNPHMNFYGVTLGARGDLFDPDVDQDAYTTPAIYNNWPARQNDVRSTVDDIWHATVNTRGEFINARTPADITAAMRRILASVSAGASPSGTLGLTGARINSRSLVVQPSYEIRNQGTDWFSELSAYKVAVDPATRAVIETPLWEASSRLAATSHVAREAHTWYGTGSGAVQIANATLPMLCDNTRPGMSRCSAADITARLGVNAAQAISYLVGDTTLEVRNAGGRLRDRTTPLGDIVNSTPLVSAPTDDNGYRSLGTVGGVNYGTTYSTYVDTTKASRPAMVYVGANDGMLHAFHGGIDAAGTVDAANGGREQFAYIPRAVLGHMGNLLYPYVAADGGDQRFDHRYFVDGPLTVSDAYFNGWKTVLVGTAGAGGRSVFGLNISNPTSFTAASRLWEIDDQHATASVRNNIGHVLGKPVIVPVRSGTGAPEWKAIFGNGYNSVNGQAALFVVDIATGAARVILAQEAGAPNGTNGVGNIVVTDQKISTNGARGRDGYADTVYAADQKGAVWKFDLSSDTTLTRPLFTTQSHTHNGAAHRQPIIGGLVATAGVGSGVMLFFGTGSFSFTGDPGDSSVQSIYAINDRGQTTTLTSANLFEREIVTSGPSTRAISTGGIVGQDGWYLDLPAGERAVGYPRVASGVLFIPTYAPSVADGCSTEGLNWLYGLDTRSGGPALESVRFGSTTGPTQGAGVGAVVLNTRGTAPVKEVGLTVLSRPSPPNPGDPAPPGDGCWMRVTVPGMAEAMFVPYPCGRQSWRQLQ